MRGIKELMTKLSLSDPDITAPEALAEAIWAFNHREIIRGFSPAQHILGQAPDETGRFLPSGSDVHPNLLVENPSGELSELRPDEQRQRKPLQSGPPSNGSCEPSTPSTDLALTLSQGSWYTIGGARSQTKVVGSQVGSMGGSWDPQESWRRRAANQMMELCAQVARYGW